MNINKNLKYNSNSVARLFRDSLAKKLLYNNHNIFKAADSFSIINDNWSYNIDATNEIVSNIANATKPYAYNTSDSKWYVKNNLDNYEQWGLMPTVSDLNNVTTYTGKLVVLSTDSHEYKWNGNQWVDLGSGIPEEYPSKPAPALSQTKASYQAALSGSYLNGQTVSVYDKTYDVSNGKLEEKQIDIVGYIKSSNPFWFDTEISPVNNDVEIELKIQMKDLSQFNAHDGGLYWGNWSISGYLMMNSFEDSSHAFKWHYGTGAQFFGTRTTEPIILKQGLTQCYINGEAVGNTYTITNSTSNNIRFFQTNSYSAMSMIFYYAKIWKNGVLVRDYVVKNNGGTLQLYDNVSQTYPSVNGQLYNSFD